MQSDVLSNITAIVFLLWAPQLFQNFPPFQTFHIWSMNVKVPIICRPSDTTNEFISFFPFVFFSI